jgi:hypothetical protein
MPGAGFYVARVLVLPERCRVPASRLPGVLLVGERRERVACTYRLRLLLGLLVGVGLRLRLVGLVVLVDDGGVLGVLAEGFDVLLGDAASVADVAAFGADPGADLLGLFLGDGVASARLGLVALLPLLPALRPASM